jgi:hypothetical protein
LTTIRPATRQAGTHRHRRLARRAGDQRRGVRRVHGIARLTRQIVDALGDLYRPASYSMVESLPRTALGKKPFMANGELWQTI